jgi:predicted oxidoreductase
LQHSITTFNEDARSGQDREFARGGDAYSRYLGDAAVGPNPCLAPIETAPFYAIELVPSDLGTIAGLRTDPDARVLDSDNRPIAGLYAAGGDMRSIMCGRYPGPGITLGPALTFGYLAALHAAAQ